jgi:hypothetical protein
MEMIKNIYNKLESSLSVTLRVSLVFAVTIVLLIALYNAVFGLVNSQAKASLETDVSGLDYVDAEEVLFAQQEQVIVEDSEDDEEEEKEEVVEDPRITAIYKSISLHFTDRKSNEERFADEKQDGLTAKTLEALINAYGSGQYTIGKFARSQDLDKNFVFPKNDIAYCNVGEKVPQFNEDQRDQLTDQLVNFWKRAEQGTDEKKSKFMQIRDFDLRLAQVYAANDLFLCEFANSYYALSDVNEKLKSEANAKTLKGSIMIAAAGSIMNIMFKFFAAFALVLLTLVLYRIEKSLRK